MKISWWDAPLTLRDSAEAIHIILTMGGSPSCFHGGSLAVRFLLSVPTPRSLFTQPISNRPQCIHHPHSPSSRNSPLTGPQQVSAHNLVTLPPHRFQKGIFCQISDNVDWPLGRIEPGFPRREFVVLTIMPPNLTIISLHSLLIAHFALPHLVLASSRINAHDTNHEQ